MLRKSFLALVVMVVCLASSARGGVISYGDITLYYEVLKSTDLSNHLHYATGTFERDGFHCYVTVEYSANAGPTITDFGLSDTTYTGYYKMLFKSARIEGLLRTTRIELKDYNHPFFTPNPQHLQIGDLVYLNDVVDWTTHFVCRLERQIMIPAGDFTFNKLITQKLDNTFSPVETRHLIRIIGEHLPPVQVTPMNGGY